MNTVTYRDDVLNEFRNNLLIEAMPEPREPEQAANDLMIFPEYHDSDRKRSTAQRRILTQNIARIHHPLLREVEVEGAIDRCIRWGYADRNPLSPEYATQLSAGYTAAVNSLSLQHAGGYHPHTYGFSILGISGIGKSTTVEAILSYYPQVIRHTHPRDPKSRYPYVETSDFVVTTKDGYHVYSIKESKAYDKSRVRELQELERRYWLWRNVPWAIKTEQEINYDLASNIRWIYHARDVQFIRQMLFNKVDRTLEPFNPSLHYDHSFPLRD